MDSSSIYNAPINLCPLAVYEYQGKTRWRAQLANYTGRIFMMKPRSGLRRLGSARQMLRINCRLSASFFNVSHISWIFFGNYMVTRFLVIHFQFPPNFAWIPSFSWVFSSLVISNEVKWKSSRWNKKVFLATWQVLNGSSDLYPEVFWCTFLSFHLYPVSFWTSQPKLFRRMIKTFIN